MLWEPSSCCCFSLRTGSYVLASIVIGFGILNIMYIGANLTAFDLDTIIHDECKEAEDEEFPLEECVSFTKPVVIGLFVTKLVLEFLQVIFSCCLIHGIRKNKTRLMVPYMIWMIVGITILIIIALSIMGLCLYIGDVRLMFIVAVIFGAITFLETYFLLVIRALYFQLKRTKGQAHMTLKEEVTTPEKHYM